MALNRIVDGVVVPYSPEEEAERRREWVEETKKMEDSKYKKLRNKAYGNPASQIEFITENGLEAWQEKVAEIKKKYPKPS